MKNMTPQEFLETGLIEQYVMGLLSPEESTEVAAFIDRHPSIKKTYDDLQESVSNLAESHAINPPAHIKSKVMERINQKPTVENSNSPSWTRYITGIAAVLLGIISILSYNKINTLKQDLSDQKEVYSKLASDCEESKIKYEDQNRIYAFYKDARTKSVILEGNEKTPNFQLVSRYNKESSKLVLEMKNSFNISEDKMFCLWGDKDGEMILITKVEPSTLGSIIPFDGEMNSLNVTLEDRKDVIDHPDVSQLIASVSI